ncbi:nucleotidyltransferase domain-containing protein [Desulfovermiculus halophilus]|jgi:hypothetical protein|uniref:nucleotidyltransferase domain-containing protein n=1 Tax=Desulfovermiculus halophilus TaxID=339722 RepID=UPI000488B3AA|nr:nucleotidyltransferase domain-containing protein [Desulfovermiculus halophilus]
MDYQVFSLSQAEKDSLVRDIGRVLQEYVEIMYAYVHGSFVHEPHFRDLDIGVWLYPELVPEKTFSYEDTVAQKIICKTGMIYPADVRILNQTSIPFQYKVFQGELVVDRDPETRCERIEYIVSRYLDMRPVLNHAIREVCSRES